MRAVRAVRTVRAVHGVWRVRSPSRRIDRSSAASSRNVSVKACRLLGVGVRRRQRRLEVGGGFGRSSWSLRSDLRIGTDRAVKQLDGWAGRANHDRLSSQWVSSLAAIPSSDGKAAPTSFIRSIHDSAIG